MALLDFKCTICDGDTFVLVKDNTTKRCECYEQDLNIRRIKASGLEAMLAIYTFDKFNANHNWQKHIKTKAIEFANSPSDWFYIGGQSGSGKTHLCTAIAGELLKTKRLRYMLWRDDAVKLKSYVNDAVEYKKLIEPLKTCTVLYIDDFLKTGNNGMTTGDINIAFEILNYRYNNPELVTIISSEYLLAEIIRIDEAIAGRIKERCKDYCFEIGKDVKKNYRLNGEI